MSTIKNWFNWRTIWTLSSIRAKKHSAAHFQIMSIQLISAYIIRPKIGRLLARYLAPAEPLLVDHRFAEPPPAWHTEATSDNLAALVASCDIDHSVAPSIDIRGGRIAAEQRLRDFLENDLRRYALYRNEPSAKATSRLSPYLHFGYLSSLEAALAAREHAERHKLIAEEFLEELIVRRELAFNFARHMSWPATLDDLPEWVRKTLAKHSSNRRPFVYTLEEFERAATHVEALATMIYLHDRYALDGRDPNTYTNIPWCFGLHDRPWRERDVFGMIRYMSLEGMKRKTNVDSYVGEMNRLATRQGSYTIG